MENNKKTRIPRIAAIHDLSGFGRCALTVILPVISSMGLQAVPVPTALLSTHTGGFTDMYFEDLTEQMDKISAHFDALDIKFDAIYTGFLGSEHQIEVVSRFIDRFGDEDCLVFVDPVMGDDGELYSTYTKELANGMKKLCEKADIITPNLTEACFLAGVPYTERKDMSCEEASAFANMLTDKISEISKAETVITGLHCRGDLVATYVREKELSRLHTEQHVGCNYPGTGDIFASVLLGRLLNGASLFDSAVFASAFTRETVEFSMGYDTPVREGVSFEPLLYKLTKQKGR